MFLALTLGFALLMYRSMPEDGHWVGTVFSWGFILLVPAMGTLGAFVIVPALGRILGRLESLGEKSRPHLPSFDLARRMVNPSDSRSGHPFDSIVGLKSTEGPEGWRRLVMLTRDGQEIFLVNYPVSQATRIGKMLERISELTALKILP